MQYAARAGNLYDHKQHECTAELTSIPPANRENLEELECRQIWCSPGVWEVKVNRPSDPY